MYEKTSSSLHEVDHYWHMVVDEAGVYPNPVSAKWGLVFVEDAQGITIRLIGPQTKPTPMTYHVGQEYWGVVLQEYTGLIDTCKVDMVNSTKLLGTDGSSFVLAGNRLPIPRYENLDSFARICLQTGIFMHDKKVAMLSKHKAMSIRTKQRLHKNITGLTSEEAAQAARIYATIELLAGKAPLAEVAQQSGFADQAHMTRVVKALVGLTPTRIRKYYQNDAIVQ